MTALVVSLGCGNGGGAGNEQDHIYRTTLILVAASRTLNHHEASAIWTCVSAARLEMALVLRTDRRGIGSFHRGLHLLLCLTHLLSLRHVSLRAISLV